MVVDLPQPQPCPRIVLVWTYYWKGKKQDYVNHGTGVIVRSASYTGKGQTHSLIIYSDVT